MIKYSLDFILHAGEADLQTVKTALTEFCEELRVRENPHETGRGSYFAITLQSQDPTLIFDICSQFGRIKSVKVQET